MAPVSPRKKGEFQAEKRRYTRLFRQMLVIFSYYLITKYLTDGETETSMKVGFRPSWMGSQQIVLAPHLSKTPNWFTHPEDFEIQSHREVRSPLRNRFSRRPSIRASLRAARRAPGTVHGQCTARGMVVRRHPEHSARRVERMRR